MRAEEVTSSWEEIVDMMAARMAASMNPATRGWKSSWPRVMNTVSGSVGCSKNYDSRIFAKSIHFCK